jgi:hypothetical protein
MLTDASPSRLAAATAAMTVLNRLMRPPLDRLKNITPKV